MRDRDRGGWGEVQDPPLSGCQRNAIHRGLGTRLVRMVQDREKARADAVDVMVRVINKLSQPWTMRGFLEVLGLGVPLATLFIAAAKVLILADFDMRVLPVVLRGLDFVAVAFSVFLAAFPPFLCVLAFFCVGLFERLWSSQWWGLLAWSIVLLGLSIVVLPILFSVTLVLFSLARAGRWLYRRRRGKASPTDSAHDELRMAVARLGPRLVVVAAAFVALGGAVSSADATWLPTERVETTNGTRVGWVLDAGDHGLTMLEASTGVPFIIRQDDVVERSFCVLADSDPRYAPWVAFFSTPTIVLFRHEFNVAAFRRMPDCWS